MKLYFTQHRDGSGEVIMGRPWNATLLTIFLEHGLIITV